MNKYIAIVLVTLLCGYALSATNMRGVEVAECISGTQTCIHECACGFGYRTCSNGKWYMFNSPAGSVCVQNTTEVFFEPIINHEVIEEVCGKKFKDCGSCNNGKQKCVKECDCFSGYMECKHGEYTHMTVENKVCKQVNPMRIELVVPGTAKCPVTTGNCHFTSEPEICIDGQERCSKQCSCGYGYEICSNNKWYAINIPEGTVCSQVTNLNVTLVAINDDKQIHDYCPKGLNGCPSQTKETEPMICHNGYERCDKQCECGAGYKICDNNKWVHLGIPKGSVCSQMNPTNITLVSIYDNLQIETLCPSGLHGNCGLTTHETEPFVCTSGIERCDKECNCDSGYKVCDNNKWINFKIPSGAVCSQISATNITLVAINDNEQIKENCPTGLHGDCHITVPETEPFVCLSGVEKCDHECDCNKGYKVCGNNKWINLPLPKGAVCAQETLHTIVLVATNDNQQIQDYCPNGLIGDCIVTTPETEPFVCHEGVERCLQECGCGSGYKICANNKWVELPIAKGSVCAQLTYSNITLVAINDPLQVHDNCPTGLHGDCGITTPETEPFVCETGVERCELPCDCDFGYKVCGQNKWIHFPIPKGSVCAQYSYSNITLVAINDDAQITEYCPSGLHGNCGTITKTTEPLVCIDGVERCEHNCHCGSGYQICDNNKWVHLNIPKGSVCAQDTPINVTLVSINDDAQIIHYCPSGLSGDCGITTHTTEPLVCFEGHEKCQNQCNCGSGYFICAQNQWRLIPMSPNTVCAQNGTSVLLEFACSDLGDQGLCTGIVTGNCGCNIHTTFDDPSTIDDGSICKEPNGYYCKHQCKLHSGYYHCVNGNPKYYGISDKTVCWQSEEGNIQLVHSNAADGYQFGCDGKVYN